VPRFANARVISATNTELLAQVQEGRFRRDLFYRLAVVKIDVPPLRERREDLPLLIEHFLQGASARTHRALGGMTERARLLLLRNPWTGNIRELKNVIEGAAALVPEGGLIDVAQIQAQTGTGTAHEARGGAAGALHEATSRFESDFLERVLSEHRWNVSRCAKELRISRQHLHNLVRRYGLVRPGR
jgi:transcriptional regulator with PAS, ATPase and Fis domain